MRILKKYFNSADNILFIAICFTAFCIPLIPKLIPVFVVALFLIWLSAGKFSLKEFLIKNKPLVLVTGLFYFYNILSISWSQNIGYGVSDIDIKLSLLIFPIVLSALCYSQKQYIKVFKNFIGGNFLLLTFLIAFALYKFYLFKDLSAFFYTNFAANYHPAYLALYFNFCILLLLFLYFKEQQTRANKVINIVLVFFFAAGIFLLSSRGGIFSLAFSLLGGIILFSRQKIKAFFYSLILGIAAFFILQTIPFLQKRLNEIQFSFQTENLSSPSASSSSPRIQVWKNTLELFRENLLFGVGAGDIKDELKKKYQENDFVNVDGVILNSHNQYLQTAAALGLPGLILLLLFFFIPLYFSIKYRSNLVLIFTLIVMFNLLFESMLERQAGIAFFSFFAPLLLGFSKTTQSQNSSLTQSPH
jgi:O-antigen ligase